MKCIKTVIGAIVAIAFVHSEELKPEDEKPRPARANREFIEQISEFASDELVFVTISLVDSKRVRVGDEIVDLQDLSKKTQSISDGNGGKRIIYFLGAKAENLQRDFDTIVEAASQAYVEFTIFVYEYADR